MKRSFRAVIVACSLFLAGQTMVSAANDNWMSRLSDETYVSQLSIPGTHDSATGHGFQGFYGALGGETNARTQDKTISEQWACGVRAFDLRPCVSDGTLQINHGIIQTKLTLKEALQTLCSLLEKYPTEIACVMLRHETEGDDDGGSNWNSLVTSLLNETWLKPRLANFLQLATVGQLRGKLLLLSRNEYASAPMGGFIRNWSSSAEFANQKNGVIAGDVGQTSCYIQDFYDCSGSGGTDTKRNCVTTMLRFTTTENTNPRIWAINHTSGYSKTASLFGYTLATSDGYRANASVQNQAVIDYLSKTVGPTGFVMMDFAGVNRSNDYDVKGLALVNALVENNFRFQPQADTNWTGYVQALAAIEDGKAYRIFTEKNGKKYYLNATGFLVSLEKAALFTFKKVRGEEYEYGFQLMNRCFTNPRMNGSTVVLSSGRININTQSTPRPTWEAQVFFLKDGKYAVRATNAAGGDSGWSLAAKTYWTINSSSTSPTAQYGNKPDFIWQIEDETAGIGAISVTKEHGVVYNLAGQRVDDTTKGILIVDGKKVLSR